MSSDESHDCTHLQINEHDVAIWPQGGRGSSLAQGERSAAFSGDFEAGPRMGPFAVLGQRIWRDFGKGERHRPGDMSERAPLICWQTGPYSHPRLMLRSSFRISGQTKCSGHVTQRSRGITRDCLQTVTVFPTRATTLSRRWSPTEDLQRSTTLLSSRAGSIILARWSSRTPLPIWQDHSPRSPPFSKISKTRSNQRPAHRSAGLSNRRPNLGYRPSGRKSMALEMDPCTQTTRMGVYMAWKRVGRHLWRKCSRRFSHQVHRSLTTLRLYLRPLWGPRLRVCSVVPHHRHGL
ncbi:hypothetical protein DB88DRAFT_479341 [Papiliotrema laurentii]|uniref:Uncharacterized protein n=1 Tax=Papiliotrema laurentii TaxID=5418 RepID=A0AAD9FX24_PAPLA|nr:hypothetical protein DB88DRAFT_479341 [Papiliotrema laurentii]